jgi:hypothetical protein
MVGARYLFFFADPPQSNPNVPDRLSTIDESTSQDHRGKLRRTGKCRDEDWIECQERGSASNGRNAGMLKGGRTIEVVGNWRSLLINGFTE